MFEQSFLPIPISSDFHEAIITTRFVFARVKRSKMSTVRLQYEAVSLKKRTGSSETKKSDAKRTYRNEKGRKVSIWAILLTHGIQWKLMAQFCHKIVFSSFLSPHTNNKHNNNKEQENHFCLDMLVSNSYLAPIPTFSGSSTTLSMVFQVSKCYLLRLCLFSPFKCNIYKVLFFDRSQRLMMYNVQVHTGYCIQYIFHV